MKGFSGIRGILPLGLAPALGKLVVKGKRFSFLSRLNCLLSHFFPTHQIFPFPSCLHATSHTQLSTSFVSILPPKTKQKRTSALSRQKKTLPYEQHQHTLYHTLSCQAPQESHQKRQSLPQTLQKSVIRTSKEQLEKFSES